MIPTARTLREAQNAYEIAVAEALHVRNEIVRDALEYGWPERRVADAMGLSRGWVHRIGQKDSVR